MKVYQIRMEIFLLEDIVINKIQEKITAFIDSGFKTDEEWLNFHEKIVLKITAMISYIQ